MVTTEQVADEHKEWFLHDGWDLDEWDPRDESSEYGTFADEIRAMIRASPKNVTGTQLQEMARYISGVGGDMIFRHAIRAKYDDEYEIDKPELVLIPLHEYM